MEIWLTYLETSQRIYVHAWWCQRGLGEYRSIGETRNGPVRTEVREEGSRGKTYQNDSLSDDQNEGIHFTGPRGEPDIFSEEEHDGTQKHFEPTSK